MAGPWFVDAINGSTTNNGLSADTPWKLAPGMPNANLQAGYGVVAGDLIRVRNGSVFTDRITVPADNLTYTGYGVSDNILRITLPAKNPMMKAIYSVSKNPGVDEGMWTVDASNIDLDGAAINTSTRSGTVFEDINILGPRVGTRNAVTAGVSSSNASGFTMRRFKVESATNRGISGTLKDILLEWGIVSHTLDDNIMLNNTTANSSRNGSTDILRYLELREPNRAYPGAPDTGAGGDAYQTIPNSASNSDALAKLIMHDIYCHKSTLSKQLFLFHDALNGNYISRILAEGGGDIPILFGGIRGELVLEDIVLINPATEGLPSFRYERPDSGAAAYCIANTGVIKIRRCMSLGRSGGFLSLLENEGAATVDGTMEIDRCYAIGSNVNSLSWSSTLAFRSADSLLTFEPTFRFRARNNVFLLDGGSPNIRMPTGTANTDQFKFENNIFIGAPYNIGTSSYSSIASFQSNHNRASSNVEETIERLALQEAYKSTGRYRLDRAGVDLSYLRDIEGVQGNKDIGPYSLARLRS